MVKRRTTILILAGIGAIATVGVGYGAIPGEDGTVKACYATTGGGLLGIPHSKGDTRIVDSGEACRSYEKTVSWNQRGPKGEKGETGATGATGAQGPRGDKGDPGPSGTSEALRGLAVSSVSRSVTLPFGAVSTPIELTCPANRLAVQLKSSGDLLTGAQNYEHSSVFVTMIHNNDLGRADQTSELTLTCFGE